MKKIIIFLLLSWFSLSITMDYADLGASISAAKFLAAELYAPLASTSMEGQNQIFSDTQRISDSARQNKPEFSRNIRENDIINAAVLTTNSALSPRSAPINLSTRPAESSIRPVTSLLVSLSNAEQLSEKQRFRNDLSFICSAGPDVFLKKLTERKQNLNVCDGDGNTPLHHFVCTELMGVVDALIEAGADINVRNRQGQTPLMRAIKTDKTEMAKFLMNKRPKLDLTDCNGQTALIHSVLMHNYECTKALIENRARCDIKDTSRLTALNRALNQADWNIALLFSHKNAGKTPFLNRLLENNLEWLNARDSHGNTALLGFASIKLPNTIDIWSLLKALIQAGADPAALNNEWQTFLMKAVEGHNHTVVRSLIAEGADVNARDINDKTAIMFVNSGDKEMAEMLIASGADVNKVDKRKQNAYLKAVERRDIDLILYFSQITEGAKAISITKGPQGKLIPLPEQSSQKFPLKPKKIAERIFSAVAATGSKLINAVSGRNRAEIESLLSSRLHINEIDETGKTALMIAVEISDAVIVKLLLEHGANVHMRDSLGETALMKAVSLKNVEIVRLLVEANSVITNANSITGKNALDYALNLPGPIPSFARENATYVRNYVVESEKCTCMDYIGFQLHYQRLIEQRYQIEQRIQKKQDPKEQRNQLKTNLAQIKDQIKRLVESFHTPCKHHTLITITEDDAASENNTAKKQILKIFYDKFNELEIAFQLALRLYDMYLARENRHVDAITDAFIKKYSAQECVIKVFEPSKIIKLVQICTFYVPHKRTGEFILDEKKYAISQENNNVILEFLLGQRTLNTKTHALFKKVAAYFANLEVDCSYQKENYTVLMVALSQLLPSEPLIKWLIEAGAYVNAVTNLHQFTPLDRAIHNMHFADGAISLLLKNDADPNIANSYGETPLMLAARYNRPECVRALLEHRALTDVQNNMGETPIGKAVLAFNTGWLGSPLWLGMYDELKYLPRGIFVGEKSEDTLKNHIDILNQMLRRSADSEYNSLLFESIVTHINLISLYLEENECRKAKEASNKIKAVFESGGIIIQDNTTVMEAILCNDTLSALRLIKEKGNNLDKVNSEGLNAVMMSVARNNIEVLKALLEEKIALETLDHMGENVLMKAVIQQNVEMVALLVNAGAIINNINPKSGKSAYTLAEEFKNERILEIFDAKLSENALAYE